MKCGTGVIPRFAVLIRSLQAPAAARAANAAQASDAFRGGYAPTPTPAGQCGRIGGLSIVGVYTSAGLPDRQPGRSGPDAQLRLRERLAGGLPALAR